MINNIYKTIRFAGLFMLLTLLAFPAAGQGQREKKVRQLFDVVLKVVDENGAPVEGASVVVGEGITHAVTDASGSVSFKGYPEDLVTITAFKFDKKVIPIIDVVNSNTVTLLQGKVQMTSGDVVQLPFTQLKKRSLTGPET
ncbi:MAG: carboxypeptidase-like regulatory domain-containing protein, partial [Bacteroidales bacterium]|nr:carboxypeptidase-like regulatory domain-containing protein [Bacteroidales bacterium]